MNPLELISKARELRDLVLTKAPAYLNEAAAQLQHLADFLKRAADFIEEYNTKVSTMSEDLTRELTLLTADLRNDLHLIDVEPQFATATNDVVDLRKELLGVLYRTADAMLKAVHNA